MGVITAANPNIFKSANIVFSKVKRFLSSYHAANLIDEGEFPTYVKEALGELSIGAYRENDAVIKVKNYKALLPKDFSMLYAAYKCSSHFGPHDLVHPQGTTSVFNDVTWELLEGGKGCEISCEESRGIIEKVTVRQYVKEHTVTGNLTNPVLLSLSPNVKRNKCAEDCQNLLATSPYEITIDNGFLITNFNEDYVYLKYWEFPKDDDGVPMIPDIDEIEAVVEWYIIHQLLLKWQYNKEVTDIERTVSDAERKYTNALANAKYYLKLPSFSSMVNTLRRQRSTNLLMLISQQG